MYRKLVAAAIAALCVLATAVAVDRVAGGPSRATASRERPTHNAANTLPQGAILASYPGGNTVDTEIREPQPRADGYYHVDTPATIAQLKQLHVTTYLFLVWHSPTDWTDLTHEFLAAAERAGIDVWVYLVPPSECHDPGWCSQPYRTDYVAWADAIAHESTKYRNLTGWAIDDFTNEQNSQLFDPAYMQQIKHTVDATNPDLGLWTTTYYPTATDDAFYARYAPYIKGIIFPYRDYPYYNTQVTATLPAELDAVTSHADAHHVSTLLMIYTGRYSTFAEPTVDYVRSALTIGRRYLHDRRIAGVASYGTPHLGAPAVATDTLAMYGRGSAVIENYGAATPTGTSASVSQRVDVDPDATRYTLSFWRYNRYYSTPTPGRVIEVLVDNHVVWSSDIASDAASGGHEFRWQAAEGPIEIDRSWLHGHSHATLTFRVNETQPTTYRSLTAFDTVQASGLHVQAPGFEDPRSWHANTNSDNVLPSVNVYDPDLPSHVFRTVAAAFAR